jgi:hypothetical protein
MGNCMGCLHGKQREDNGKNSNNAITGRNQVRSACQVHHNMPDHWSRHNQMLHAALTCMIPGRTYIRSSIRGRTVTRRAASGTTTS